MSDYIDTREGWRPLEPGVAAPEGATVLMLRTYAPDESGIQLWVREAPVPPLPDAPYTVIRVTSTSGMESILIRNELGWYEIGDMSAPVEQPKTGWSFEVLSEPRAVTAKAVLDEVGGWIETTESYDEVARKFGVSS